MVLYCCVRTLLLNEYYRNLYVEERIHKNPMDNVEMMKKANFLSAQGKEDLPECETIEVFTDEELEKFKAEAFRTHSTGSRCSRRNAPKRMQPYAKLMLISGIISSSLK